MPALIAPHPDRLESLSPRLAHPPLPLTQPARATLDCFRARLPLRLPQAFSHRRRHPYTHWPPLRVQRTHDDATTADANPTEANHEEEGRLRQRIQPENGEERPMEYDRERETNEGLNALEEEEEEDGSDDDVDDDDNFDPFAPANVQASTAAVAAHEERIRAEAEAAVAAGAPDIAASCRAMAHTARHGPPPLAARSAGCRAPHPRLHDAWASAAYPRHLAAPARSSAPRPRTHR